LLSNQIFNLLSLANSNSFSSICQFSNAWFIEGVSSKTAFSNAARPFGVKVNNLDRASFGSLVALMNFFRTSFFTVFEILGWGCCIAAEIELTVFIAGFAWLKWLRIVNSGKLKSILLSPRSALLRDNCSIIPIQIIDLNAKSDNIGFGWVSSGFFAIPEIVTAEANRQAACAGWLARALLFPDETAFERY